MKEKVSGKITLRFFGQLRLKVGVERIEVPVNQEISLKSLIKSLAQKYPRVNALLDERGENIKQVFLIFINGVDSALLGGSNTILKPGDIIDLVPISHGG